MPHYSDQTLANVGDVVKGKGYNIKDSNGELKEIVGVVIGIVPNSESCNIRVAVIELEEIPFGPDKYKFPEGSTQYIHNYGEPALGIKTRIEYGQCDHFLKI